jgi:aminoglycoside 6'-N-acetyltransferase I
MAVSIQILNFTNADLLNRIGSDVFDNAIDPSQLRAFLDDPRHLMVLAVDSQTVVGMASAVEYFHPDKSPQLWINEVGVAATHRNRGVGRQLVETLLSAAKARGCCYAWLGTDIDNEPAQACFGSVPGGRKPQAFCLFEWNLDV